MFPDVFTRCFHQMSQMSIPLEDFYILAREDLYRQRELWRQHMALSTAVRRSHVGAALKTQVRGRSRGEVGWVLFPYWWGLRGPTAAIGIKGFLHWAAIRWEATCGQ